MSTPYGESRQAVDAAHQRLSRCERDVTKVRARVKGLRESLEVELGNLRNSERELAAAQGHLDEVHAIHRKPLADVIVVPPTVSCAETLMGDALFDSCLPA